MRVSNNFEVSLPPAEAWKTLMNIPAVAPCLPGAELTEVVDAETYKGKVAVRMGPVLLSFAGTAKFEERDDVAHRARVKAQGLDSKGRGGASAVAEFRLEPSGAGSKVLIDTDLNLSGSVAQYGRGAGVIQTIAAQLITQFSKALEKRIASSPNLASSDSAPSVPATDNPGVGPVAKPIGGFSLVLKALWASITGLFGGKNES